MQNNVEYVKNSKQIKSVIKGQKIIDDVYDLVLNWIKLGITEKELEEYINQKLLSLGGEKLAFDTIVAFGENAAEPHHIPTERTLKNGEFVLVDMGVMIDNICSDFTRTFAFGEICNEAKKIYNIVKVAQELGMLSVSDNMLASELDKVVRDNIISEGFGEYYIHSTGHGVGEEIHEYPTIKSGSQDILLKNMVVTIEPGIYIKDKLGVRIEDMVIVGTNKRLSRHKTELIKIER